MTIAEIESTLHTLLARHPDLDEGMLVTMLSASGWEEKTIKEAVVLFKGLQKDLPKSAPLVNVSVKNNIVIPKSENKIEQGDLATKQTILSNHATTKSTPTTTIPTSTILTPTPAPKQVVTPNPNPVSTASNSTPILTPAQISGAITKKDIPKVEITTTNNPLSNSIQKITLPNTIIQKDIVQTVKNIPNPTPASEEIVYFDSTGNEESILPNFVAEEKEIPVAPKPKVVVNNDSKEIVTNTTQSIKTKEIVTNTTQSIKTNSVLVDDTKDIASEIDLKTENLIIPETDNSSTNLNDVTKPRPNPKEPQSLIEQKIENTTSAVSIEPPENLPLKPFESTSHIWPFSKYKEVFHREDTPNTVSEEDKNIQENIKPRPIPSTNNSRIKFKRTGFDGEDEGLIFLTGITLLIILLLLAYMYSNGRL